MFFRRPGAVPFSLQVLALLAVVSSQPNGISLNPTDAIVQTIDGQMFGPGLIIVDSPQPNTPSNSISPITQLIQGNIPIAIDISGDGELPLETSLPGSTNPTTLFSLNIFLSSLPFNQNLTVSPKQILSQESGSTVKHLNFQIQSYACLQEGTYNLSFHESFRLNGTDGFYTVLDIPIVLRDLGQRGDSPLCNQNSIVMDIAQRIPIPRPLGKINGQIIARFNGSNSASNSVGETTLDSQTSSTNTDDGIMTSISGLSTINSSISGPETRGFSPVAAKTQDSQGVIPFISTVEIIRTATVQAESISPPKQTDLDESTFGGPGGDLTNVGNENAFKLFQRFNEVQASMAAKFNFKRESLLAVAVIIYLVVL